ncbi:MAG: DUF4252 domain-containing protein [Candidatus Poribacteria bacterium]|nr:DUF4252 domain-containing protein [Candidatus Poribacteria bacterium]
MKLQKHLTLIFTATFLAMLLIPINYTLADKATPEKTKKKGLIPFDHPQNPEAKVEVNLTDKLINRVTKSMNSSPEVKEMVQMLDGIYVRTYDSPITTHGTNGTMLVEYYQEKLKKEKWEVFVKIKEANEMVEVSLLYDEDVAYGIFAIVVADKPEKRKEVTFVNIVGKIATERISDLLGNLSNFGTTDIDLGDKLKVKAELNPDRGTVQKEMLAVKIEKPPKIDGKLDDKCWKIAPQTDKFTHASTEKPVKDQTIVKLVYTDKAIYVAWRMHDSDPKNIVKRQTKDHIRFVNEDSVCFSIDPFHTHRSAQRTLFMANPLGKKFVQFATARLKNSEYADRWKVAAKLVKDGWVVEMEIPWQILDYPETTEPIQMGINFDRKQQRTSEHSWWSNVGVEKLYSNDGNWMRVLPPSKSLHMQGMLDAFEKGKSSPVGKDFFRLLNTSGLNSIDGLRLGGGFEIGKRWYYDPLFFERSGETIRRDISPNATIGTDGNDFGGRTSLSPKPFAFGTMSYALRTEAPNYRLGGGVIFGEKSNLTYSAQIHRLTSARDRDLLLSGSEQFLRAFTNADFNDYYTRQGGVMALQWQHASLKHTIGLSLLLEEHESIWEDSTSYFRIGTSSYHLGTDPRPNSPIYDGKMHSISLKYDFDTRENTKVRYDLGNRGNNNEWYNTFLVEHSNSAMGSDYDFTRFIVHLRNYHPIGDDRIDTRLKVGLASTSYMLPYQRQFVLGGTGTLRGYSLYEFVGNHGFLFNLEYTHSVAKGIYGIYIVPFVDIGQTYNRLVDIKHVYPKANFGIGFQFGIFRLNLARALESDRGYQVNFKWSRTF